RRTLSADLSRLVEPFTRRRRRLILRRVLENHCFDTKVSIGRRRHFRLQEQSMSASTRITRLTVISSCHGRIGKLASQFPRIAGEEVYITTVLSLSKSGSNLSDGERRTL